MPSTFEIVSDILPQSKELYLPPVHRGQVLPKGLKASIRGPTAIEELVKRQKSSRILIQIV